MPRGEQDPLRAELRRRASPAPARVCPDPEQTAASVAKLVLSLVELLRALLERQALRRMDTGTLTPDQIEGLGLGLMRLEETIRELALRFDLSPDDLNLDLGPLGRLR